MNRATVAYRLGGTERAPVNAILGIGQQSGTRLAQLPGRAVMGPAVYAYHCAYGAFLPLHGRCSMASVSLSQDGTAEPNR